jgi:DNA-binding NtrC family response regulator
MSAQMQTAALPQGKNLVLIESCLPLRAMLAHQLRLCGFHVIEAATSAEGFQTLRNTLVKTDGLITDIAAESEVGGLAIADWMFHNRPGVPVFLTGWGNAGTFQLVKELGHGQPFFIKPYNPANLAGSISRALSRHAANPFAPAVKNVLPAGKAHAG